MPPIAVAMLVATTSVPRADGPEPSFADKSPQQKAAWGENVFALDCLGCHSVSGKSKFGPSLHGLIGRPIAGAADFAYSAALRSAARDHGSWTTAGLNAFLANPQLFAPGTQMWVHVPDEEVREALIAFFEDESKQADGRGAR